LQIFARSKEVPQAQEGDCDLKKNFKRSHREVQAATIAVSCDIDTKTMAWMLDSEKVFEIETGCK
jgi:hypothetical protein